MGSGHSANRPQNYEAVASLTQVIDVLYVHYALDYLCGY